MHTCTQHIITLVKFQRNVNQTGGTPDIDLNVIRVWQRGFHGEGTIVTILDDGVDYKHPELRNNYVGRGGRIHIQTYLTMVVV